jgi:hypothetical protein
MNLTEALDWIEQAGAYRDKHILSVGLTGGEPFYDIERLEKISRHAKGLGLFVTTVTNAFWATTKQQALEVMQRVEGIAMVSLSTDAYHLEQIPLQNIKNAIWAAGETNHLYDLTICTDNKTDPALLILLEDLHTSGMDERVKVTITAPVGRAQKLLEHHSLATDIIPAGGGCALAGSPLIFHNGVVIGCTGAFVALPPTHPLVLGDLRQEKLATILDRAQLNPLVHTLRLWGPYGLYTMLKERGYGELLPGEFIKDCPCDACYKLFTNPKIITAIEKIMQEKEMLQMIAYGRASYLGEPIMVEKLNLPTDDLEALNQWRAQNETPK